jgi:hypothetical protein
LLAFSSMAAAAVASNTKTVTPMSPHAKAAPHTESFSRMAAKTCTPDSYQRSECIEGYKGVCTYYRDTNCKTTRTCKVVKPAPRC